MKKLLLFLFFTSGTIALSAQSVKVELYDLLKKLLCDSTGSENVGDWAVGQPRKYPVTWKADKLEMSADTSINFYRVGTIDLTLKGQQFLQAKKPVKWNIILKGARSGYSSFSIVSSPSSEIPAKYNIDSVLGKRQFTAKLLKSCDEKEVSGYNYYELKLPKKDIAYLKLSWISINGNGAIRIDCFDSWSNYAVKLDCVR